VYVVQREPPPGCPGPGLRPLGNVDCLPGTQVPRGFYLIEFELNCSPTLGSEKIHKITNWKACQFWFTSLSAVLQKLLCAVRGFASWQSQQRRLGSPYAPPHLPRPGRKRFPCQLPLWFYVLYTLFRRIPALQNFDPPLAGMWDWRYLRVRGTARAGPRGPGVGLSPLSPRPQAAGASCASCRLGFIIGVPLYPRFL
jgi:hypothetical protein